MAQDTLINKNDDIEAINNPLNRASTVKMPIKDTLPYRPAKNAIFFEFMGNGGLYSFNYDRVVFTKNKFSLAGRLGFSYLPEGFIHPASYLDIGNGNTNCIPVQVLALYEDIELGLGYTPAFVRTNGMLYDLNNFMTLNFGYRYQPPGKVFFFKSGVMVVKNLDRYLGHVFPYLNVAWGVSF